MPPPRAANSRNRFPGRRRFLKQSAALSAGAASIAAPALALGRARPAPIKVGVLHPVTGALAIPGKLCRDGALMAIEDINAAGGIRALGGARIEAVLGDARSDPDGGTAEVEKMNAVGVCAIVGGYANAICLATTQAAAHHHIAHLVDLGAADAIVERGLANTFRFGPGFRILVRQALHQWQAVNTAAGAPTRTMMVIHEEPASGCIAELLAQELPACGLEVQEVIRADLLHDAMTHDAMTHGATHIVARMRDATIDLVIAAGDGVPLVRTMRRQPDMPPAVFSVFGGLASNPRVAGPLAGSANDVFECDHGFNPHDPRVPALRRRVEARGRLLAREFLMNYTSIGLLADAIERAAGAGREHIIAALQTSTWAGHVMPYGETRFVDGQNLGARPLTVQIQSGGTKVIAPTEFRQAAPVFRSRA